MVQLNPQDIERPFADKPMRRMITMVGRALLLKCPNCGSRGLVKNWFKLEDRCPSCGLRVEREGHDYMAGSVMFNLVLAELIFAFTLVAYLLIAWPNVNWDALEIAAPLGMAAAPFVLFPFAKLVWLAADTALRPAHASELNPVAATTKHTS
ncbi:MAG: TFIIB-type zinc ribbon-containing protein [Gemmatimonadaceae bacterium]|nr:TFIIB-type zinc ribbon-containing protein [Gemmatimonadaceae bacterium]